MKEFTICNFPHDPPKGYSYKFEKFNSNLIAVWLHHSYNYSYTTKSIRTIWGFYSPKKKEYYYPINSSKCGDKVDIQDTTPYTSMPLKLTPLEKCFYD